ncbi:MAG: hypothetical protein GWN61_21040 [candidate division Zixibacteria bacterium]|nr:hypothetical protein [candidate division Zixibacteria bacterium]NIU16467.1 hypothetical protein [candidate division Zixibacteria bacterium]NIV08592.1 hypothetical protein [candidate division Zixibacteria bacterium]
MDAGYAYIADWTGGVAVLDVTDITQPVLIQELATPGRTRDIFVTASHVFIADYEGGVRIYDKYGE